MLYDGYNQQKVAVIDAFSTGHYLGPAFRARGVQVVHVTNRNSASEHQLTNFHSYDFSDSIDFEGDVTETAKKLSLMGVSHVIAGTESGTTVADLLGTEMGLKTANAAGFGESRRDKRLMHQAVHKAGVPIPWQIHLDNNNNVIWKVDGPEPESVIVKPSSSAGTDMVRLCHGNHERELAVTEILTHTNVYGEQNKGVVVQEYLPGNEYMINTVSVDGEHAIVEVWKSVKKLVDSNPIYDYQILENPNEPKIKTIINYVYSVLTSLGVRWGGSHTEVIVTPRGPLLLETATRLPGGADPSLGLAVLGRSHLDEVVDSYLAPDVVVNRGKIRPLRKIAMGISFISPCSGHLSRPLNLKPIIELPSFHGIRLPIKVGDSVSRTVDIFSKPGGLYLCHENRNQLVKDYEIVRKWEESEFANAISRN